MTFLQQIPLSTYSAFAVSFIVALCIVLTKGWHGHVSYDQAHGVQKNHTSPTPRIGGAAVIVGVISAYGAAGADKQALLGPLVLAGIPAFVFGFWEDITNRVSVRARLLATMFSGLLGYYITGYSLTHLALPVIDPLLSISFISLVVTAIAIGGVANAINIIDGANGLASGFTIIALIGYTCLAYCVGDTTLAFASLAIAAAIAGFFFVNWPFGKLFLGDGGAYFAGFSVAWIAVVLVERNTVISPFSVLLVCMHPITEVLFSIYRRKQRKLHPGHPDRHHLHTLVMLRYMKKLFPNGGYNSLTGLAMALLSVPAVLWANFFKHSTVWSALGCLLFMIGYITIYGRIVCFKPCMPWKLLFTHANQR